MEKFLRKFKRQSTIRSILTFKIDLNYEFKKNSNQKELKKGSSFYTKNERKFTYEELNKEIQEIIKEKLPKRLRKVSKLEVIDIEIIEDYEGSIELVVAVILGVYSNIASLSDFYDSIKLIRSQSQKILGKELSDKYGSQIFDVNCNVDYPSTDRYSYLEDMMFGMGKRGRILPFGIGNNQPKREGLFWYLLISNVVMLIIIILMVYKAVIKQYGF